MLLLEDYSDKKQGSRKDFARILARQFQRHAMLRDLKDAENNEMEPTDFMNAELTFLW